MTCYNALSAKVKAEVLAEYKNGKNLNLVLKIKHGWHLISLRYISNWTKFLSILHPSCIPHSHALGLLWIKVYCYVSGLEQCNLHKASLNITFVLLLPHTKHIITFLVDIYACFLPLLTYTLAYKCLEGNLCFYYTILWILFAFLILVLLNLCMPSVFSYLQIHERQRDDEICSK